MKNNKLNTEEKTLQEKLEGFEFPYNPKHWADMEQRLNNAAASGTSAFGAFKVAAVMALIGSVAYFSLLDYTSSNSRTTNPIETKIETNAELPKAKMEELPAVDTLDESLLVEAEEIIVEEEITENEKTVEDSLVFAEEDIMLTELVDEEDDIQQEQSESKESDSLIFEIVAPKNPCLYISTFFKIKNREDFAKVNWKINGKKFSGEYQFFEAGRYTVIAQSSKNNILYSDTIRLDLLPEAEFDFTYEQMQGIFNDFSVQFHTDVQAELNWSIQGKTIQEQEPFHNFKKEGLYDVTAYAINENGCKTELYKPVVVMKDFHFYAPDAFTPNNDGINDIFLPPVLKEIEYHFDFMVYDISGAEVFKSSQKEKGWNGKLNNSGQKLPIGNYIWKVLIKNEDGRERRFTGSIKIVELD